MGKNRYAKILIDDHWFRVEFKDLQKFDTFILFEPDGRVVIAFNAKNEMTIFFCALGDPEPYKKYIYQDKNQNILRIDCIPWSQIQKVNYDLFYK